MDPPAPERIPDRSLVMLVGASGSGKSTWADEIFPADQIVSTDGTACPARSRGSRR